MNIEQRLAEAIQSFSLDALAGAVPLNVDLDVVLSVLAHTVCAALRRRLPGYATATPDTLQRRFLNTGGHHRKPPRPDHHPAQPGAPTHPSCARPACPKRSPSPGGRAAPCATSTPDPDWGPIRLVKIGANELPGPDHRPAGGHGSPIRRYVDGGQPSVRRPAIGTDGRALRDGPTVAPGQDPARGSRAGRRRCGGRSGSG